MMLALVLVLLTGIASAQAPAPPAGEEGPVRVDADESIEWHRDRKVLVARGNAKAVRGDLDVRADTLTAHYRETPEDGTEVHRLEAFGGVIVVSPEGRATGEEAVYDIEGGAVVLRGEGLGIVTPRETITARDSLEHYRGERYAVARGDARVVGEDRDIRADVLVARFGPAADGGMVVERVEAFDDVVIRTDTEMVTGRRAVYDTGKRLADICGDVLIVRGGNRVKGECAQMNMDTGFSRVLSGKGGRVSAVFELGTAGAEGAADK